MVISLISHNQRPKFTLVFHRNMSIESCKCTDLQHASSHKEKTTDHICSDSDSEDSDTALLPGLPDDLAVLCLARVPRTYHGVLKCVSKKWSDFFSSELLYSFRQRLGVADGWIYALCRDSSEYVHCYVLDPTRRRWNELPGMPEACLRRYGMACEVLGRSLYLLGGCGWSEDVTNEVYRYDPLLHKWEKVANMETARCHFVSASLNGRLYAIGGMGSSSGPLISWETFDLKTNEWTSCEDPNIPSDLGESLVLDDRIYVRHVSPNVTHIIPNVFPATYAAAHDTSNNAWSTVDNEMTTKWTGPAVVVRDEVYMLDQTSGIKLMMLDKEKQNWMFVGRLSPMLIKSPCRIAVLGNMLYVIGRGLKTVILDMDKAAKASGMLVTSSVPGLPTVDDVMISCKAIAI